MDLVTVSKYSEIKKVSIQSVYARIKAGTLYHEKKNGIKYVELDTKGVSTNLKDTKLYCKDMLKILKGNIKILKGNIKDLKKTIKKNERQKDKNYMRLENLFNLLSSNKNLTPIIEAKIVKKKKRKKSHTK